MSVPAWISSIACCIIVVLFYFMPFISSHESVTFLEVRVFMPLNFTLIHFFLML